MNRITRCTSAADKCISDAEHQRGKLESFARLAQNAQREYEEVMRLAKYDEEIRDLKVPRRRPFSRGRAAAMAWRRVYALRGRRDGVFARPRRRAAVFMIVGEATRGRRDGVVTRPRPRRFYWDGSRSAAASAPRRTPKKVSERIARS